MWKLIFDFLTEPLGLPIEWYWEYLILAVIGTLAYVFAFRCVTGLYDSGAISSRGAGSFFHWLIRLIFFVIVWMLTYGLIWVVKWICANWVIVLCIVGGLAIATGSTVIIVCFVKRKNKARKEDSICEK